MMHMHEIYFEDIMNQDKRFQRGTKTWGMKALQEELSLDSFRNSCFRREVLPLTVYSD